MTNIKTNKPNKRRRRWKRYNSTRCTQNANDHKSNNKSDKSQTKPKRSRRRWVKTTKTTIKIHRTDQQCFVYILENADKTKAYVGCTINPKKRLRQHNGEITNGARRTKIGGRPWRFMALMTASPEWFHKSCALQLEWAIHKFRRTQAKWNRHNNPLRKRSPRSPNKEQTPVNGELKKVLWIVTHLKKFTSTAPLYEDASKHILQIYIHPDLLDVWKASLEQSPYWNPSVKSLVNVDSKWMAQEEEKDEKDEDNENVQNVKKKKTKQ